MKKTNFLIPAILILTICISFISCKEASPSETLVGKWVLQSMDAKPDKEEEDFKAFMDALEKEFVGKLYYDFKADSTLISYMPPIMGGKGKTENQTWSLSSDNKTIHTTTKSGKKIDLVITSLDQKNLVFSMTEGDGVQVMTFVKE